MSWKVIWLSLKNADMRKKILAVLGMLLIFRVMSHIPVPLSDPKTLKQVLDGLFTSKDTTNLFSFIDVLSGGALANFSIMLVGLGPYINASIIMQLLTKAIPRLEALNKEGEFGRKKINQYTRMLAFPLSIVQSIGAIYLLRQSAQRIAGVGDITAGTSIMQWVLMIAALSGGSMILMWLGELITEHGLGNGISLVITVGIVSRLPATLGTLFNTVTDKTTAKLRIFNHDLPVSKSGLLTVGLIAGAAVIVTLLVVKLNEASRKITINYAKRVQGNRSYGGVTTILPVKLITAGVVPIIFALAFLSVPSFLGQLLTTTNTSFRGLGSKLSLWFQNPTAQTLQQGGWTPFIYPLTYFFLVFLFTYFYTNITFNSKEIAENLQKQGGFISGIRSGSETESYLGKIVNRLTLFGALSLGILALLPIVAQLFISGSIAIGGTSVLILVSVALETLRQIESRALMVTYDQYAASDYFQDRDDEDTPKKRKGLARLLPVRKAKGKKSTK